MLVELALVTFHAKRALCPAVIDDGVAVNELIVGAACATVAEQVVVATVEDASVPCSVIEWNPGVVAIVCTVEVLPFPHKNATGATPPVDVAVHVMLVADGAPLHVTASVSAYANPTDTIRDITNELTITRNCIL